ncbi:MATE family efflux transporter [Psychromonas aquimarina]|uniref:MATE family efflux transporter n=1 Tax=Psychromonas aquimarina TaxID=444919 RepID=UPI00040FF10E|nr:MATE family efflux transporter [Psychromonas aquimarina]
MHLAETQQPADSLARQLFTMTWPMLFGVLSLMSFQLVDSAFIGQLGVLPLAAQGFTMPVQMVVIGIQVGLGIATTAIIARALGAGKHTYARQLGGLVLIMGSSGVALIAIVLWLLRHPILSMLSAPPPVYAVIDVYWPYWLLSAWVGAVLYFYYSVCRANGNTFLPGIMMMVTSAVNLVLDPVFIFTLDMGIKGAAAATIIAFSCGILVVAPKVVQKHWASFDWQGLDLSASINSITKIMGPAMISQLLPPLSSMLATKLIAGYGAASVAAWALASRYEFFAIVAVLALTMSMPPMIGRLLGAGKITAIRQLVSIACRFILALQLLIALLTLISSSQLAALMTSEQNVESILNWHLTFVPFSLGPLGICMLMVSVSNALARSGDALLISALRLFAFFLPCLWLGAQIAQIKGLFIGALIGNCLAGLAAWYFYRRTITRLEHNAALVK